MYVFTPYCLMPFLQLAILTDDRPRHFKIKSGASIMRQWFKQLPEI